MVYSVEAKFFTLSNLLLLAAFCSTSNSFVISMDALRSLVKSEMPHPLILIPGDGGSQAYAQFRDCQSDPFPIWVDLRYLVSPRTFGDYFK